MCDNFLGKEYKIVTKPDGTIYNVYDIQDNAKAKKKSQAYPPSGPRSGGQSSEMRGKGFPDFNSNVSENGTAVNTDTDVETKHFGNGEKQLIFKKKIGNEYLVATMVSNRKKD